MKKVFAVTAAIALLCLGGIAQADITIETVPVGNPGNAADTRVMNDSTTGYGTVGYAYNIGKYEVTAGQYTAFLNAKATTDTYLLYNASMWSSSYYGCKIQRSGSAGSYTYSVAPDWANRPVNYVSFWDSLRFANWLHNGQGSGSTETGAYTLTTSGITNNTITRNTGATWAVTSENEWYKAAYYKGGGGGYWLYPTSSDTAPGRDMADASGNNANYYWGSGAYPIDSGKYTTVVGEFQNSDSPYGTFDQGGNVFEWNEAIISGAYRGARGGGFSSGTYGFQASSRDYYSNPPGEGDFIGFRVSQIVPVPEPSSLIALAGGFGMLLGLRRRRA